MNRLNYSYIHQFAPTTHLCCSKQRTRSAWISTWFVTSWKWNISHHLKIPAQVNTKTNIPLNDRYSILASCYNRYVLHFFKLSLYSLFNKKIQYYLSLADHHLWFSKIKRLQEAAKSFLRFWKEKLTIHYKICSRVYIHYATWLSFTCRGKFAGRCHDPAVIPTPICSTTFELNNYTVTITENKPTCQENNRDSMVWQHNVVQGQRQCIMHYQECQK